MGSSLEQGPFFKAVWEMIRLGPVWPGLTWAELEGAY